MLYKLDKYLVARSYKRSVTKKFIQQLLSYV